MSITVPLEGFGGGVPLNFAVKAYTSEEALLAAAPKENTIGIITTTDISSWIFSATQPAEAAEGMVWISLGTSSAVEFNALKKNALQVYPMAASQYVGGVWVSVAAYSYREGTWASWGKGISFLESEWTKIHAYLVDDYAYGTFAFSENTFTGTVNGEFKDATIATKETFDLTNVDSVSAVCTLSANLGENGTAHFVVSKTRQLENASGNVVYAAGSILTAKITGKAITIDVSKLEGSYYIIVGISTWIAAGSVKFTVSDLEMK